MLRARLPADMTSRSLWAFIDELEYDSHCPQTWKELAVLLRRLANPPRQRMRRTRTYAGLASLTASGSIAVDIVIWVSYVCLRDGK